MIDMEGRAGQYHVRGQTSPPSCHEALVPHNATAAAAATGSDFGSSSDLTWAAAALSAASGRPLSPCASAPLPPTQEGGLR